MVSLFLVSRFQTNYTILSEHCISHICCVRKTKIMRANPFKGLHMTNKNIWSAQKLVGLKSSIKSIIKLKFGLFSAAFSLLPFHLYFHHVLLYFCHVLLWTTVKPYGVFSNKKCHILSQFTLIYKIKKIMFCFPFYKINDDNVKVFPHIVLNRLLSKTHTTQ